MIFLTDEDGNFIITEAGIFLTLDLVIYFAEARRTYTAIPREDEFTAIPRVDEFTAIPRTDELRLTGD